jgi:ribosomal protein S18 acetylase RimI-like enzyme
MSYNVSDGYKAYIRIAIVADAEDLAENLRQADLDELKAGGRTSPLEALKSAVMNTDLCYVARELDTDKVICLFGLVVVSEQYGVIWMLGSDLLVKHRKQFIVQAQAFLDQFAKQVKCMGNTVYSKNTLHIAWLRKLGFKFISKIDHPTTNEPFYEFIKICATP